LSKQREYAIRIAPLPGSREVDLLAELDAVRAERDEAASELEEFRRDAWCIQRGQSQAREEGRREGAEQERAKWACHSDNKLPEERGRIG
jgi:hypothetical protein